MLENEPKKFELEISKSDAQRICNAIFNMCLWYQDNRGRANPDSVAFTNDLGVVGKIFASGAGATFDFDTLSNRLENEE